MKKLITAGVAAIGLLALASAPSSAQEWPTRGTIRMIVPYPAGGGTDVVARIVAKYLQDRLHQTIIVDNRGGANGQIGLQALKQSAPDGYTMAMTSNSPMTVNKWVYKIDPLRPDEGLHPRHVGDPPAVAARGASVAAGARTWPS